jgi:hypothetical protein
LEKVSSSIVLWSVIGYEEGAIEEVIVSIPVPDASDEAIEVIWNTPRESGWTRSLDTGSTYWFWAENGTIKSESPAARFGSFCKHQLAIAQAMGVDSLLHRLASARKWPVRVSKLSPVYGVSQSINSP